ncbi:hypothetical protein QNH39_26845 [Neobacillus novalis]|uniref:Uncharacterized protein n=1 Tax=Neobacillus novalis TaxID=220687 RepID=A0AA95MLZ3_9BACI|nr:hypothetical protein [Neobacillus novalis]WHY86146.1 hypothetical protein QNH39_26845 [Neobacillus novalis]
MAKNDVEQKENEKERHEQDGQSNGDNHSMKGDREHQQSNGDNHSIKGKRELQERYRDGTSMQGDIKDQQQKLQRSEAGPDANQDDELQKKYGHREEGTPPPMNGEIESQEGDDEQESREHQQFSN